MKYCLQCMYPSKYLGYRWCRSCQVLRCVSSDDPPYKQPLSISHTPDMELYPHDMPSVSAVGPVQQRRHYMSETEITSIVTIILEDKYNMGASIYICISYYKQSILGLIHMSHIHIFCQTPAKHKSLVRSHSKQHKKYTA